MAIRFDEYKGFVLDPHLSIHRPEELTTGIDKLPIKSILALNETDGDIVNVSSKKSKRAERQQQQRVRMSKRKLKQTTKSLDDNPYKVTNEIKKIYSKYNVKQEIKLLQYGSVSLYSTDLTQVLPGEWINDNIISIIYEYLNINCLDTDIMKKSITLMVPSVVQLIAYTDFDIIEAKDFKQLKFIFLPINETEEGDHWVLGVLNLLENKFLIYDSMTGDIIDIYSRLLEKFIKLGIVSNQMQIQQMKIEQQTNFDDCGVYLLMISCYLIHMLINEEVNFDLKSIKLDPITGRLHILKLITWLIDTEGGSS